MINGLPVHPLLVHFALSTLLLTAVLQVVAVARPTFRRWLGWGLPAVGVLAAVLGRVTHSYGEILLESGRPFGPVAQEHARWGSYASTTGIVLGLVTVAYWLITSGVLARRTGSEFWQSRGLVVALSVVAVAVSAAEFALLVKAGDLGSRSVWG